MAGIDIYHSRRGSYNYCPWWSRDEGGVGNSEEYVYNRKPSGYFYAKKVEVENQDSNIIMGAFMADHHRTMIESKDDLEGMHENAIVKYKGELWRVESIQKNEYVKETEFSSVTTYVWNLQLER